MNTYHPSTKRNRTYIRTPLSERFWQRVNKTDGCWLWTGATHGHGYGMINTGGRGRAVRAHRVSWELHNGPIPIGLFVCHHCDNRLCVNPAHLFLGTNADNMRDMVRKNRQDRVKRPRGERCRTARLTAEQVVAIRSEFSKGGVILRTLGEKYGVSLNAIHAIVTRKSWKHVD